MDTCPVVRVQNPRLQHRSSYPDDGCVCVCGSQYGQQKLKGDLQARVVGGQAGVVCTCV
jgi:hypothetical protein